MMDEMAGVLSGGVQKIVVGIATNGRPAILRDTLLQIARQTRRPDAVIVCAGDGSDVNGAMEACPGSTLIFKATSLPGKRNAILAAAADADLVVFFDDDFIADVRWLEQMGAVMERAPDVVVATGTVLADGITGPGLTAAAARGILAGADPVLTGVISPVTNAYGCNMALRTGPMRRHRIVFDERLALYGWQEDVDLSLRLARFGRVVRIADARGVHLGVKGGRASGLRLGYSQVANPIYLAGKKAGYPLTRVISHIGRNMAMNLVRAARPEPYVDRRGRLLGNLLAFGDLVRGRMVPERILEL
jgi:GT2 family glycosyltransferase